MAISSMPDTQETVESGEPLVMDALAESRKIRRDAKITSALHPEPTLPVQSSAADPGTVATQEPVAAVPAADAPVEPTNAGESKTEPTEQITPPAARPKRDYRIDEYYNVSRKAEELERKVRELEARAAIPPAAPAVPATDDDPKPVWNPETQVGRYKDSGYEGFTEDLGEWSGRRSAAKEFERRFEQQRQQEQQALAERTMEEQVAAWRQAIAEAGITDYWEVAKAKGNINFSPKSAELVNEVMASPVGPQIAHYLNQNPHEIIRIDGLGKRAQFKELEALENRFKTPATPVAPPAQAAVPPTAAAPVHQPGVSKAPPPPRMIPAGGSAKPPTMTQVEAALQSPEVYQAWMKQHGQEIVVKRGIHNRKGY